VRFAQPLALAAVIVALGSGCGNRKPSAEQGRQTVTRTAQPVDSSSPDSVFLETRVTSPARLGEAVPVTLAIRNDGLTPRELHFRGRTIVYDIVVEGPDGHVVWRRLEGAPALAILRVEVLAPGQELTFTDHWLQRDRTGGTVAPGIYTIHGEFPSDAPEPRRTPSAQVRIVRE
jgi:intracellular proteinase inhibitor BsuPI